MSDLTASVDKDEAERLLTEEWNHIRTDETPHYLSDEEIAQTIREVLNASQITYKYILVTNILAKAVNSDIHYRAMQAQSELPGAYNARSLGHQVLVEWEKEHGERLGGSNEPFLNKPARYPEFSMENAHRSETAHQRLYELLSDLETKTDRGKVDPVNVLRRTLYEISRLEPQVVEFEASSDAPFRELRTRVSDYLSESGGGERLAAVTAGVLKAYYCSKNDDSLSVEAEHANVPDEFSNAAGDVEVYRDGSLVHAVEVKDKPSERSDLQHAITKAQENELGEYLYVVGNGFRDEHERRNVKQEIAEAPVEIILVQPEELIQMLKFVGGPGRILFTEIVGEYLNEMRASEKNKEAWANLIDTLETGE